MSAYVGKATAVASGSQSSVSVTYSPVAGNSLWLLITYDQSGPYALAANAIKDQANNNIPYIELGTGINIDASYTGAHVVYCPNVPSGVTSVKATMASTLTQGMGMTVVEYSGQSTVADRKSVV